MRCCNHALPKLSLVLALMCACSGELTVDTLDAPPLDAIYERAANEFGVPADILKSIGYVETRWTMVIGKEENGRPGACGIMAVRGHRIEHGAALASIDAQDVCYDEESNIRAAAALLDEYATAAGIDRADLEAWAPVVGTYSDIEDPDARAHYVGREVFTTLAEGAEAVAENGEVIAFIDPIKVRLDSMEEDTVHKGTSDYPASVWRPSGNYNYRPSGSAGAESMVVMHTCEGSYSGCWGWLRNPAAQASAHYVVSNGGGEITQLVREYRRAWHVAATYSCSRNGGVDCWRNGQSVNNFSIGIELAGYASQSSFPSGQIEATAKLVCNMSKDHGIKRDRNHIVAHGRLQPWNRTDPGPNFPWTHFMNRVKAHCGDGGSSGGGTTGRVIDSNNARNNTSRQYVSVSGNWNSSNYAPGYFGTGYWWAGTKPISDGARFRFYLNADRTKTVDAWWTTGSNRSGKTPFVAIDSSGKVVGTVYRNQRKNGKRWNKLGTWHFKKGWNEIVVSRWAPSGKVVIADAIRIR